MERILIKPKSQEIVIKGPAQEGHGDTFVYDYDGDEARRQLGNLFIVGNITNGSLNIPASTKLTRLVGGATAGKPSEDVTYVTNLVASLAKREYYSNPSLAPRDAFAASLRKVNDVVEEFFSARNGDAKINIGVFAIAGDQVFISKLGKFKVILSRDNKNIDILNNIELFTKEYVEEKQFSNIISGSLNIGDRILAFYPNRALMAREKMIKTLLTKSTPEEFVEKIKAIKEGKDNFACTALYINIQKFKESALKPRPQPKELTPPPQTTMPIVEELQEPQLATTTPKKEPILVEPAMIKDIPPTIISSEFSLGKKSNLFSNLMKKIKLPRFSRLSRVSVYNPKRKIVSLVVSGLVVVVLGGLGLFLKSAFWASPAEKALAAMIKEAQNNLNLAKDKINQNDLAGARELLASSITTLTSNNSDDSKAISLRANILDTFDGINQAQDASLSLVEAAPQDVQDNNLTLEASKSKVGENGMLDATLYEGNLYFLTETSIYKISDVVKSKSTSVQWLQESLSGKPNRISVDGNVYTFSSNGTLNQYYKGKKTKDFQTGLIVDSKSQFFTTKDGANLYLIDDELGRIYVIKKDSGTLAKTLKIGNTQPILNASLASNDTIYITTSDNKIWKIIP